MMVVSATASMVSKASEVVQMAEAMQAGVATVPGDCGSGFGNRDGDVGEDNGGQG